MNKPVSQMTADEYKTFLLNNPDEAKKLDEPTAKPVGPTGYWRNGTWIALEQKPVQ
jgi:hypothetical protein